MCTPFRGIMCDLMSILAHFSQCDTIIWLNGECKWAKAHHCHEWCEWWAHAKHTVHIYVHRMIDIAHFWLWLTVVGRCFARVSMQRLCVCANGGHSYDIRQRLLPVITLAVHSMATMYFLLSMTLPLARSEHVTWCIDVYRKLWRFFDGLVSRTRKMKSNPVSFAFGENQIRNKFRSFQCFWGTPNSISDLQTRSLSGKMAGGKFRFFFSLSPFFSIELVIINYIESPSRVQIRSQSCSLIETRNRCNSFYSVEISSTKGWIVNKL